MNVVVFTASTTHDGNSDEDGKRACSLLNETWTNSDDRGHSHYGVRS